MLGFMSFDIKSEKLTVFEMLLIFAMQVWAQKLMRAVVKVHTPLCFIVGWVVEDLGLV